MQSEVMSTTMPQDVAPPPPDGASTSAGPNPLAVIGAAVLAGFVVAKVVDWRGHAHPRD